MNDDEKNTSQTDTKKPEATVDAPIARDYFFPEHGKTVIATSLEEAQTKLATLLKKETKTT